MLSFCFSLILCSLPRNDGGIVFNFLPIVEVLNVPFMTLRLFFVFFTRFDFYRFL